MSKSTDLAATVKAKGDALTHGDTIFTLIERQKPQIALALGKAKGLDVDRFARIVLTEVRRNPQLAECNPQSFLGALMLSAQLGLEPGPLGHCFFIPFGKECQLVTGYKGLIWLAWNSSQIVISANEVYENDDWDCDQGLEQVRHRWDMTKDRGRLIGVWARAVLPNGMVKVKPMSLADVEKHRKKSKAPNGPAWTENFEAMAKKTVIRVLMNELPLSAKTQRILAADEVSMTAKLAGDHIELEGDVVVDGEGEIIDIATNGFKTPLLGEPE